MARRFRLVPLLLMIVPLLSIWGGVSSVAPTVDARPLLDGKPWTSNTSVPVAPAYQPEEGVYRVYYTGRDQLAELAVRFDIWEVNPKAGYAVLALPAEDVIRLRAQSYRMEPAVEYQQKWMLGPPGYSCYLNVDELYAALHQMVARYPDLVELIDYGDSWRKTQEEQAGNDLWVLKITNAQVQVPKPRFFLMAGIHGRELTTPEMAMYFVQHLLDSYGVDPDVTWILDYHQVYVVVTANPDGRQRAEEGCLQRKNLNTDNGGDTCSYCSGFDHQGVDLNRNNPYHWGGASTWICDGTYQGSLAASEPETYHLNGLIRSLLADQRPDDDITPAPEETTGLLISLHSYSNLVLWPWGWTSSSAPNEAQLRTLGRKFAYFNGYTPQTSSELYPTTGDTTDWAYGELGIAAYTFELGEFFFQPCEELQQIMEDNLPALLYAAKVPLSPYLTPAGPDALDLSLSLAEVPPGSPVRLTATMDDARYNNSGGFEPVQNIAAAAYYVDEPPWITATIPVRYSMTPLDGSFDEADEEVVATIDTTGLSEGRHIVFVRGQDADGYWGAFSAVFLSIREPAMFHSYLPLAVREN